MEVGYGRYRVMVIFINKKAPSLRLGLFYVPDMNVGNIVSLMLGND